MREGITMGFPARYAGICMRCKGEINQGDMISWSRKTGQKGVYHMACKGTTPGTYQVEDETTELTEQEEQELMRPDMKTEPPADVQEALQILLGALKPKPEKPALDLDAIKQVVRETITQEGVLKISVEHRDKPPVLIEGAHEKFPDLSYLLANRMHTYLHGPHGSGKSTAAAQAAKALHLPYGYSSLTPQTPESRLLGYMNATGDYIKTLFRTIYEYGGVFCIDELDNAAPALLTTLNNALENGAMAFPDGLVPRHADFVMVGTGNTNGRGANPSYPERRPFDAAFADRFVFLAWGYDEKLEKQIALAINPECGKWVKWVQSVRKWAQKNNPRFVPSPRAVFRIAEFSKGAQFSIDAMLDATVWRGDEELKNKVIANHPIPA